MMKALFTGKQKETPAISSFWFKPEKPIDYIAGQYIEMRLPHKPPVEHADWRWFTLSSSPTDSPLVSITTKLNKKPSSFKQALIGLKAGDAVEISDGLGDFVLPIQTGRQLIFVAGGIGVVPFHSIVKWLISTGQNRDITLIYAVSKAQDIIFQDLFKDYTMKLFIVVGQPGLNWSGLTGRLSGKQVLNLSDPKPDCLFYISGPNPFTAEIYNQIVDLGVAKRQIITDYFSGYKHI
jgi:ferredoxin-NADP reductase